MRRRDSDDLDLIRAEIEQAAREILDLATRQDEIVARSEKSSGLMTDHEIDSLATISGTMRRRTDDLTNRIEAIEQIIGRNLSGRSGD